MKRWSLFIAGGIALVIAAVAVYSRGPVPPLRMFLGNLTEKTGACLSPISSDERICTPLYRDQCNEENGEVWYPSVQDCVDATDNAVACDVPEASMLFGATVGCMNECDDQNPRMSTECMPTWSRPVCIRMPTEQEISWLEDGVVTPDDVSWSPESDCNGKCPMGSVTYTMCDPMQGPFRNANGAWEAEIIDGLAQPWTLSLDPQAPNDNIAICAPDIRMRQCALHPSGDFYAFIPDGLPCENSVQCYQGAPDGADPERYRPYPSACLPDPNDDGRMTCQPDCGEGPCEPPMPPPGRRMAAIRLNAPAAPQAQANDDEGMEVVAMDSDLDTDDGAMVADAMPSGDEAEPVDVAEEEPAPDAEEFSDEGIAEDEMVDQEPPAEEEQIEDREEVLTSWLKEHPLCGNGKLNDDEECDDGNTNDADGCSADCYFEKGSCGDGVVEVLLGEQCEPRKHNPALPYACTPTCRFLSRSCGDAVRQAGEQCDDGTDNSNNPGAGCRIDCSLARCGDSIVDPGEECDDGNLVQRDGCSRTCKEEQVEKAVKAGAWTTGNSVFRFLQGSTQRPAGSVTTQVPQGVPLAQSGPGIIVVFAGGAAAGVAWMRRRR